jgi:hypothetical protein
VTLESRVSNSRFAKSQRGKGKTPKKSRDNNRWVPIGFQGFGTQEVELCGQCNSQNREEGNTEKVGPKSQSKGMCSGSKRRGLALAKIPKGHQSHIPWDIEPISAFQHFGVWGIIREDEQLVVVRSKS